MLTLDQSNTLPGSTSLDEKELNGLPGTPHRTQYNVVEYEYSTSQMIRPLAQLDPIMHTNHSPSDLGVGGRLPTLDPMHKPPKAAVCDFDEDEDFMKENIELVELDEKPARIYHEKQEKDFCAVHALNCLMQRGVFDKPKLDRICNHLVKSTAALNAAVNGNSERDTPRSTYEQTNAGPYPDSPRRSLRAEFEFESSAPVPNRDAFSHSASTSTPSSKGCCSCFTCGFSFSDLRHRIVPNPHSSPLGTGNYDVNVLMLALQEEGYELRWYDKRNLPTDKFIKLENVDGLLLNVTHRLPRWKRILAPLLGCINEGIITARHWVAVRRIGGDYYNLDSLLSAPRKYDSPQKVYEALDRLLQGETELLTMHRIVTIDPSIDPFITPL